MGSRYRNNIKRDRTYVGYITFNKQAKSSFLYPSSMIGCSLTWPSILAEGPEGRRNISAKTSDDCSNSHLGTEKRMSSTWPGR